MSNNMIKVLHFSSRYEDCGVAKYLGHYIKGMEKHPNIINDYFEVSPYDTHNMKPSDVENMSKTLSKKLKSYDILHVQHEYAMYANDSFKSIIDAAKKRGNNIVVTVHTSPALATKQARLGGLGPRSFLHYARQKMQRRRFIESNIKPLKAADIIIAHNDLTIQSLIDLGVDKTKIVKTIHPVQKFDQKSKSTKITNKLNKKSGDIIYCTIGFIHKYKGIIDAVKALKFLPANYKLAVLGGMKEDSDDIKLYNKIADIIDQLGLHDRVYISGFIKDDDELNAMISECDICVYPFDRIYYANVSSGSLNLAFANGVAAVAYPTDTIKEIASMSDGAVVLCDTFSYYELAREIEGIDINKQAKLSVAYAEKMAWPKVAKQLVEVYEKLVQ